MAYTLKKITPVLMVEAIEPCLPFWKALGFEQVAEVPHGDGLGFVILVKDGVELMYQTRASVHDDMPSLAKAPMGGTTLFLEVTDLEAVIKALGKTPVLVPRRQTFYGMDEIAVREPGGNPVVFAMPVKT
ncbi:MAG: hypothetical protein KJZ74_13870 [Gemmatimonadales bacterium]|nr:hypothetical protein [Gemmatimonadales bacterium]